MNKISSVDLNTYIDHMSKTTSHGNGIMLEMAVAKYRRPICIVSQDFPNKTILISNDEVSSGRYIFLAYNGCDHYDSILPYPTIYSVSMESTTEVEESTSSVSSSSPAIKLATEKSTDENPAAIGWPAVWTFDKWESWRKKIPWLICRNNKLGCAVCIDAGTTQTVKAGVQISAEWYAVSVGAKTARKLKEKIYKHRDSKAHAAAADILDIRQQNVLKGILIDADTRNLEETCRVFRTAYAVAKMDLAFTAHRGLLELQEANGLDIGKVHRSDHSCSKITNHIANQIENNIL